MNTGERFSCTQEERQMLDDVAEVMNVGEHPEIDRMIALADAERDVVNAAINFMGRALYGHSPLTDAVQRLVVLRAQDTAAL